MAARTTEQSAWDRPLLGNVLGLSLQTAELVAAESRLLAESVLLKEPLLIAEDDRWSEIEIPAELVEGFGAEDEFRSTRGFGSAGRPGRAGIEAEERRDPLKASRDRPADQRAGLFH